MFFVIISFLTRKGNKNFLFGETPGQKTEEDKCPDFIYIFIIVA